MDWPQPITCQIVRASGWCYRCDSRFNAELVVALSDSRMPSGIVYIELRHLIEDRRRRVGIKQEMRHAVRV